MSDERLGEITNLFAAKIALEDGDQPLDLSLLATAARTASEIKDPVEREAVMRYISALQEPERTIFLKRKAGWSAQDIANFVGLEVKPVCKILAKLYSDIKALL